MMDALTIFLLSRTFQGGEPLNTGGGRVFSLDHSFGFLPTASASALALSGLTPVETVFDPVYLFLYKDDIKTNNKPYTRALFLNKLVYKRSGTDFGIGITQSAQPSRP